MCIVSITLDILGVGARGDGVAELEGQRYFVPYCLPAETVEAEPLTTINPFQLAVNQTQTPVIVQHGVTAGSRITINAPLAQVQRPTGVEENQGIAEWPLKLIPQQNAGNDQWTLAIT